MSARPLILLSNDDGYDARGLIALRSELTAHADVVVCAPQHNQSAKSHALTLGETLRLRRHDETTFAVSGTPADCVYVALHSGTRILPRRPELMVSGMNHGPNLGTDVIYSGTVGAAREAAHRGIPAIAVSASTRADTASAAKLSAHLISQLLALTDGLSANVASPLLSLNIPEGSTWSVAATTLGRRRYDDGVLYRRDPRGREYLWIGGSNVEHGLSEGTDTAAWEAGIASLTPLTLELSAPEQLTLAERLADKTT